jgi:hypothetical protein
VSDLPSTVPSGPSTVPGATDLVAPRGSEQQLQAVLDRATRSAVVAARELSVVREQLTRIMARRAVGPWTTEDFDRYLALSRKEVAADRAYRAARRLFNHARQQLRRTEGA